MPVAHPRHNYVGLPTGDSNHGEDVDHGAIDVLERSLRRPALAWWFEKGPVNSCCWCFGLRTGIYLLAASDLISGVIIVGLRVLAVFAYNAVRDMQQETFTKKCGDGAKQSANQAMCDKLQASIADTGSEMTLFNYWFAIGILDMCVFVLGFAAARTGKPALVKYYMTVYGIKLVWAVLVALNGPLYITWITGLYCFVPLYYVKVLWSFYFRCSTEEAIRAAGGQGSYVEVVEMELVDTRV